MPLILLLLLSLTFLTPHALHAIDIDPSKRTVPEMGGSKKRFDPFAGDPARIQKANTINFNDLQATVELAQSELSLYSIKEEGLRPNLRVSFKVKNNNAKRTYTLAYPNAQRYDLTVKAPNGQIVYKWSADKLFTETIGTTLINPGDVLGYNELVPVGEFYLPLVIGEYQVEATLANYPEVFARATFKIVAGGTSAESAPAAVPNDSAPTTAESEPKLPTR
jgi:Intracellular proteinase inhibitor